ncbi:MAG: BRCT domain-containing protein, partial [Firmicutes bacterium]|nr:BRCT domain-containing protein [Bacillota bacterium]
DNASYYNAVTSSIQFLTGMIHGVMADGELGDKEISAIESWINANDFLAGTYPYDEINSLLNTILADKKIEDTERETLLAFFSNLVEFKDSLNLQEQNFVDLRKKYSVDGICAICPEIKIDGHTFCFTGESHRATRKEIADIITQLGGVCRSSVSKKTDYLIVGNGGNPCWAYACYGRKIEEAVNLRKAGAHIIIVNETDFWDVVDDTLAGIE